MQGGKEGAFEKERGDFFSGKEQSRGVALTGTSAKPAQKNFRGALAEAKRGFLS